MSILHRSRRSFIALLACLPLTAATARPPIRQSPVATPDASDVAPLRRAVPTIGMNLDGASLSYWGSSYPFIDRARNLGKWGAKDRNWNNLPNSAVIIDPKTNLPAAQPANIMQVNNLFALDPLRPELPRRYVVIWKGKATVAMGPGAAENIKRGDHSFAFDYTGQGLPQLELSNLDSRDPLTELHIVRADQLARFQAGEFFSPDFLAKISNWSTLRFMDWGFTNGSKIEHWDQMPQMNSTWGEKGVPLSVMVDLANTAGKDMWYCIPAHADDDLIRRALTYIRDHLDPAHKVHIEYSNEVWNGGFEQTYYVRAQGEAVAKRLGLSGQFGGMEYYGYRSAQIAKITDAVFGGNARARARNVVGTQTYWGGLEDLIWVGVKAANLGAPNQLFEEYAITTYFGHSVGGGNETDKAKVLSWARQGPSGMDAAFRELTTGGMLSDNSSLEKLRGSLEYHAKVARRFGLDLVAYEGGHHLTAAAFQGKDQEDMVNLIQRLTADPRMGDLYARMVDEFGAVGGKTLVAFNDVGKVSQYGAWGVLDDIYQQHSPRYDALVAAAKRAQQQR